MSSFTEQDWALSMSVITDVVLALPWNLETELTEQLSYIADWGGQLFFPLPTLHKATDLDSKGRWTLLS